MPAPGRRPLATFAEALDAARGIHAAGTPVTIAKLQGALGGGDPTRLGHVRRALHIEIGLVPVAALERLPKELADLVRLHGAAEGPDGDGDALPDGLQAALGAAMRAATAAVRTAVAQERLALEQRMAEADRAAHDRERELDTLLTRAATEAEQAALALAEVRADAERTGTQLRAQATELAARLASAEGERAAAVQQNEQLLLQVSQLDGRVERGRHEAEGQRLQLLYAERQRDEARAAQHEQAVRDAAELERLRDERVALERARAEAVAGLARLEGQVQEAARARVEMQLRHEAEIQRLQAQYAAEIGRLCGDAALPAAAAAGAVGDSGGRA